MLNVGLVCINETFELDVTDVENKLADDKARDDAGSGSVICPNENVKGLEGCEEEIVVEISLALVGCIKSCRLGEKPVSLGFVPSLKKIKSGCVSIIYNLISCTCFV
jgi:hypothetical protein